MKGFNSILATSVVLNAASTFASVLAPRQSSLPTVSVKGNAFFAGSNRFYIRGIDYQPGGSSQLADPIADAAGCARDIPEFTKLGINAVRVYSVDNSVNHDSCMNALEAAGIYLILDVNSPLYSINRQDPAPSYNAMYLQSIFATIDEFAKYSNTLAFFSGNEVINETTASTVTAPYIKAVTRDMKQYIGDRGYRQIPVGYSAADVTTNRYETAEYMNCGTDDQRSDFFAFNDYSWCDPSSYTVSGWDQKVALFSNYSLPIFLSEYGCNTHTRTFEEVASLYGPAMTPVYSGGLVYEYSQEANDYGLVTINGNSVSELPDFAALQAAYQNTSMPTGDGGYKSTGTPSNCPAQSSTWLPGNDALPAMPAGAVTYLTNGAGTGPGLKGNDGDGSQNAGGASSGTATAGSGQVTATAAAASGGTATGTGSAIASKAAAANLHMPSISLAPFVCGVVVVLSSMLGATLVL
ncbi:beta-glucanosyltransferase [Xylographa soralifera]|nr:beta-glucanosyltransferase [Xylographa soralifera]